MYTAPIAHVVMNGAMLYEALKSASVMLTLTLDGMKTSLVFALRMAIISAHPASLYFDPKILITPGSEIAARVAAIPMYEKRVKDIRGS